MIKGRLWVRVIGDADVSVREIEKLLARIRQDSYGSTVSCYPKASLHALAKFIQRSVEGRTRPWDALDRMRT